MIFLAFIVCCLHIANSKLDQNAICVNGVPILTRQLHSDGSYLLETKCLCPADYRGDQCKQRNLVYCSLTPISSNLSINESNFQKIKKIQFQFQADCFVENQKGKVTRLANYLLTNNKMNNYGIERQLIGNNSGLQIVWSNRTDIFDQKGRVKEHFQSKQQQKKLINGQGEYNFTYKSTLMGFPLTDSSIDYLPKIVLTMKNSIDLGKVNANVSGLDEYLNSIDKVNERKNYTEKLRTDQIDDILAEFKKIVSNNKQIVSIPQVTLPRFSFQIQVDLQKSAEMQNLRVEVKILEKYHSNSLIHVISLNSAEWRIPVRVQSLGQPTMYNANFNKTKSRLQRFALMLTVLLGCFLAYKYLPYAKRCWQRRRFSKDDVQFVDESERVSAQN